MDNAMGPEVLTAARMIELLEAEPKSDSHKPGMAALAAFRGLCVAEEAQKCAGLLLRAMPEILCLVDMVEEHPEEARTESDIEGLNWQQVAIRLRQGIKSKLAARSPALRRAVALPLLKHKLDVQDTGEGTATALLDWTVQEKFLALESSGFAAFRGLKYAISHDFGLTDQDREEVRELVAGLCRKAKNAKPAPAKQAESVPPVKPAQYTGPITGGEAWFDGKPGRFKLPIPPANGHDRGGSLEMESQPDGFLLVAGASNGFKDLESESLPFAAIKAADGSLRQEPDFPEPLPHPDRHERRKRLAKVLIRGFGVALQVRHDIDPREFLSSEVVGDSLIKFEGVFRWKSVNDQADWASFKDLALRFSRRYDGQVAVIEIPPELESRLGPEVGKYHKHGYAFSGMPLFLMLFLKASYGQVVQAKKSADDEANG